MRYQCDWCGFIFDEELQRKLFSTVGTGFFCIVCGGNKNDFRQINPPRHITIELKN